MPSGETSKYNQEMADKICECLADGMTLRETCRQEGFPPESTVRRWVLDNREGFAAQYTRAREIGYHSMADELLEVADNGSNDWMLRLSDDDYGKELYVLNGEHVQRSRLRLDTRKWLLSKALPKVYGEKLALSGDEENPVKVDATLRHTGVPRPEDFKDPAVLKAIVEAMNASKA